MSELLCQALSLTGHVFSLSLAASSGPILFSGLSHELRRFCVEDSAKHSEFIGKFVNKHSAVYGNYSEAGQKVSQM